MTRISTIGVALATALLVCAPATAAQGAPTSADSIDARWLPWLGCWRPADQRAPEEVVHICVVPEGADGVRILTRAGDQTVFEETIVPNGAARPVNDPTCQGARKNEWSADGQRLFASAELTCEKESTRSVSGITVLTPAAEWLDVQVITSGARENVRVRRYQRSSNAAVAELLPSDLPARSALSPLGSRMTIGHVIEASTKVTPRVLEALLFETRESFPIDSRQLIALDAAGVPDTVIDLMVAFTFPKKFEVKRSGGGMMSSFGSDWGGFGWSGLGLDAEYASPWFHNPYYSYFSPFGLNAWNDGDGYYYSPYGYGPYGYGPYGAGGGVIAGAGDGGAAASDGHGRVVNRGGYTQVVTRAPETDGAAVQRGRSGDISSGGFGDASSGSSGGSSGVSSGGYSSGGGGGGDSGRTAVPR